MKLRLSTVIPLTLIGLGVLFTSINVVSFLKGYLAIEQAKISPEEFEGSQSPISLKESPKKEISLYKEKPKMGEKIGELTIPSINQNFPIYEGTTDNVLKQGVGHYQKSVLPGEKNNSIISGHRDTVFRGLRHVKEHDELIVTTEAGQFLYKIKSIRIVEADDTTVMTPKPRATLTVTTCYPFYYLGDAPQRYVLYAELITSKRV